LTTVNLVDTPGFNDTNLDDEDIYYKIIDWLKDFHGKGQKLSGLIYLHPINNRREKGSDLQSLKVFKKLVGSENYTNIIIGLTFYDLEDPEAVMAREQELRESSDMWADMIAAGATVVKVPFNKDECISLIKTMIGTETMTLQAERELFEQNLSAAELSAMTEMRDQEDLKIMRLKEEMEQISQQMIFDERIRLMSEFSVERAALEQELFKERQTKQALEEEILLWKAACEKEKEDSRALELQHSREEQLRKQKAEQEKREMEMKAEIARNAEVQMKIEKSKDIDHAMDQAAKIKTYVTSKAKVFWTYLDLAEKKAYKPQSWASIRSSINARTVLVGAPCNICWLTIPLDEPLLGRSTNIPHASYGGLESSSGRSANAK
jgi:hypothetical protein